MIDKRHLLQTIYANVERIEQALTDIQDVADEIGDVDLTPLIEAWVENVLYAITEGHEEGVNVSGIVDYIEEEFDDE